MKILKFLATTVFLSLMVIFNMLLADSESATHPRIMSTNFYIKKASPHHSHCLKTPSDLIPEQSDENDHMMKYFKMDDQEDNNEYFRM